jgi:organic hydroperoxide reductase OsmC/OhrA
MKRRSPRELIGLASLPSSRYPEMGAGTDDARPPEAYVREWEGREGAREVDLSVPEDMGGQGGPGTNPEQLFAVGYGACFQSAQVALSVDGTPLDRAA